MHRWCTKANASASPSTANGTVSCRASAVRVQIMIDCLPSWAAGGPRTTDHETEAETEAETDEELKPTWRLDQSSNLKLI
jgi:hypothetical protein